MADAEQETVVLRNKIRWILDNTPAYLLYDALLAYTTDAIITAYMKGYEAGKKEAEDG